MILSSNCNKHEVIVTLNKLVHVLNEIRGKYLQKSKLNKQVPFPMVFDSSTLYIKPDSDKSLKDIGLEFLSFNGDSLDYTFLDAIFFGEFSRQTA